MSVKTICLAPNLLEVTIDVEAKPLQEQMINYNTIELKHVKTKIDNDFKLSQSFRD